MKTINEVYKMSEEELKEYYTNLYIHYDLVKAEVIKRIEEDKKP